MTAPEVRYDVAASDGEVIGADVEENLKELIVGCVDGGPALVRVHPDNGSSPEVWAVLTADRRSPAT